MRPEGRVEEEDDAGAAGDVGETGTATSQLAAVSGDDPEFSREELMSFYDMFTRVDDGGELTFGMTEIMEKMGKQDWHHNKLMVRMFAAAHPDVIDFSHDDVFTADQLREF
eukprot:740495-Pyramimonas_sp.AAC.1